MYSVLSFLSSQQLAQVGRVCKRWRFLSGDRMLWQCIDLSDNHCVDDNSLASMARRGGNVLHTLKLCGSERISTDQLVSMCTHSLRHLREIHLCQMQRAKDDLVMTMASECSLLETVSLIGCGITDASVLALGRGCNNLRELSVKDCINLTDDAFIYLGGTMQSVNMSGCYTVTAATPHSLALRCPRLEHLNLNGIAITDEALLVLAQRCSKLHTLVLSDETPFGGHRLLTDAGLADFRMLPNLRILNLQGANMLTDSGILTLSNSCPNMKRLNIGSCFRITDRGLSFIVRGMQDLSHLSVFRCFNVTDEAIMAVVALPRLQHLNLHNCVSLVKAMRILVRSPQLHTLNVAGCTNIPPEDVDIFQRYRPNVKIVNFLM